MEEILRLCRINSEGCRMSAATQEYEMNTKQIFAGVSAAIVLALTSPAYAGLVGGGAGGNIGGGLNGNLPGFGGRSIGGAGGFAAQGQFDQSLKSVKTKPVTNAAKKVDDKADNAAKSTVQSGRSAVESGTDVSASAAAAATKDASGENASAMTNVAKSAPAAAAATPAKSAPAKAAPAMGTQDVPTAHAKPSPSGLTGSTDQTPNAGGHSIAGRGSFDAEHSKGSNSLDAAGSGSLN
jgi:NAD(P)H-dependent FMN reductase